MSDEEIFMVKMRKNNVVPPPAECPLSACMNFIRGAWSANIIWYLMENPRRFSELKADIKGVSAKVLSARLKELEEIGVIHRQVMDTSPPTVEYSLTMLGRELQPAIVAIVKVGHKLKQKKLAEV
ncbi:MAG TPA: helix-turn-helix domain-containing protein [Cellvibrio sp.]|nr:helix-turn-helix domain-containing protein [Cellvibrio sp.]